MYNASDCYFDVMEAYEDVPHTALIVPIDFWNKNQCWDDSIGGHNVNNEDLIAGGCCEYEMMEGVFECIIEDIDIEEFKQKMISAGFTYNSDLRDEQ